MEDVGVEATIEVVAPEVIDIVETNDAAEAVDAPEEVETPDLVEMELVALVVTLEILAPRQDAVHSVGEPVAGEEALVTFLMNTPPTTPGITITPEEPLTSDDLVALKDGEKFESNIAAVVNTPPTVEGAQPGPEGADGETELVCEPVNPFDADGDELSYVYGWYVNGELVEGETGPTLSPEYFVKDDEVTCLIVPHDGEEQGGSVVTQTPLVIANLVSSYAGVAAHDCTTWFENIRVRKFAPTDPTGTAGSPEGLCVPVCE